MKRAGFTLIELLVVFAILLVLATLLLPAMGSVRHRAEGVSCKSNLRGLHQAMLLFAGDHNGYFPFWFADKPPYTKISWIQQIARNGYLQVEGTNYFESPAMYCVSARRSARQIMSPKLSYAMMLRGSEIVGETTQPLMQWPMASIPGDYIMLVDSCRNAGEGSAGTLGIWVKGDFDVQAAVSFRHAGGTANTALYNGSVQSYTLSQMLQPIDLYRYSVK